jgi:hypothetical protein
MNAASTRTLHIIEQIVKSVPIGTNLGLLQLIWAMISGAFLPSRGAVHTALALIGLSPNEIRRSWSALRYGVWHVGELLARFQVLVAQDGQWQAHDYSGYRPLAVDLTAIWRPRLQGWAGKLYRQLLGKSFVGICYGLVARVGYLDGQRMPLLAAIVRGSRTDPQAATLKLKTLKRAVALMEPGDVLLHDAGVSIAQVQEAHVPRYLIRLSSNCTGRRPTVRAYKGVGVYPSKGELVRPLERTFKGRFHEATPQDITTTFDFAGRQVVAKGWLNLMRADLKVSDEHELFSIWVFDDPLFEDVLVLGTNLPPTTAPLTLYQLYIDRWPVEQIPLVGKQLLGCFRQFVFVETSCWRLGELALFVGNLLTWLAATSPAMPVGYWDLHPKKRPAVSDGSWHKPIWQKRPCQRVEFVEKVRLQPTYQKELLLIGERRAHKP